MPRRQRRRPIWTLDCETDPFKKGRTEICPFLWGLFEGEREIYHEFEDVRELIKFIESEYVAEERPIVYAHNGGKFDYMFLKEYVDSDSPIMVINGRMAKFHISGIEFRDSLNILPVALKNFEKEKIDYATFEREVRFLPGNWDNIRRYLRSDCVHLYEFIERYQRDYGRGLTQAGASMAYWSKHFGVKRPKQTEEDYKALKPYFYGGRVQCFEQGHAQKKFKLVDVRSAYPYAMLRKHPYSTKSVRESHLPAGEDELGPCLIRLDAIAKDCFPLRDKKGSLFFPHDERTVREYFITGWELMAGLEFDAVKVIRIKEVHRFQELIDFKDYIQHFYEMRKQAKAQSDKAMDIFAKLFMNSLYGKFASDPSRFEEWLVCHLEDMQTYLLSDYGPRAPWGERYLMSRPIAEDKRNYYNIATSASITGFERAHLFRGIMQVSRPMYCDTDSIMAEDVSRLSIGGELGQWGIEMECEEYAIAGKKLYAIKMTDGFFEQYRAGELKKDPNATVSQWKIACKGVDLDEGQIIDICHGKTVVFEPEAPTFSILKSDPVMTNREISLTARDIRVFPD